MRKLILAMSIFIFQFSWKKVRKIMYFILLFFVIILTFCGPPNDQLNFIRINDGYSNVKYYLDSPDSLVILANAVNTVRDTQYAWFKAEGAVAFYSSYTLAVPKSDDTAILWLKWKPHPDSVPPTGLYIITAHMHPEAYTSSPWHTSQDWPCTLLVLGKYMLAKWSGDKQKVRLYEALDDTSAYRIRTRLTNSWGQGVDNELLTFTTNKGYFKESYGYIWTTITKTIQNISGIAEATLCCNVSSSPCDSFDYEITVTSDTADLIKFYERCADDNEISNLPVPWTHKKRTYPNGLEIKGDVIPDGQESTPANNEKNIKLEIDYDPNVISLNEVCEVACSTWNILERGRMHPDSANSISGIWVNIANISDKDTVHCSSNMTLEECRNVLARSRDSLGHIHCIFGTTRGDSFLGINIVDTIFYPNNSTYGQRVFRFGRISSGEGMQTALNKSGVFAFVNHIKEIANNYSKNWKLMTAWTLAHEIGHALQMGHTLPDSFQTNIMHVPLRWDTWAWDSVHFFNIKSLQDAFSPPDSFIKYWRPALTTREQLGINTVGFNYYDRQGGKMLSSLIPLVMTLVATNPGSEKFVDRIPKVLSQHLGMHMGIRHKGHSEPCIAKIEADGNLGILYLTQNGENGVYNYVRYDTLGNIVLDLRNFKTTQPPVINDLELIELISPCANYVIDNDNNLWLFYTDGPSKQVGWLKVDRNGRILEEKKNSFVAYTEIIAIPSEKNKFHLLLSPFGALYHYDRYFNYNLKEPVNLGPPIGKSAIPTHPFDAFAMTELKNGKVFVVSIFHDPPFSLRYFILNNKGEVEMKSADIPIDSVAYSKIENHGMVFNIDAFNYSDSILVAVSIWTPWLMKKVNTFYLVKFDANGNLVKPTKGIREGKIHPAEAMPKGIKPSIVMTAYQGLDKLWYYGVDGEGNLYLKKWSRKE